MAIDLKKEKERIFSSQDIYDILSMAMQISEVNGFINTYVLDRAIYVYGIIIAYEDRKNDLASKAAANVLDTWDELVKDGTVEQFMAEYPTDLDALNDAAADWYEDFSQYSYSARGLLDTFSDLTGGLMSDAVKQFSKSVKETDATHIIDLADKWGMNNSIPEDDINSPEEDSIFN